MATIQETITEFNKSARKVFGSDVTVLVARSPAFGDDDICFVVEGRRQNDVARDLLRFVRRGKISESTIEFMGERSISTTVEGLAR